MCVTIGRTDPWVPERVETYAFCFNPVMAEEMVGIPSSIKASAAFGALSTVFGFVALAVLFSGTCFSLNINKTNIIALTFLACAILDMLTFVAFAADGCEVRRWDAQLTCDSTGQHLGSGAIATVFAIVFWILAAIATLKIPHDNGEEGDKDEEEESALVHESVELQESAPSYDKESEEEYSWPEL